MEENINVEISKTILRKELPKKYKINFLIKKKKDNFKVYICTEYKTLNKR